MNKYTTRVTGFSSFVKAQSYVKRKKIKKVKRYGFLKKSKQWFVEF